MRIVRIILFSLFTFHFSLLCGQTVSEIPVTAGEHWWGMYVGSSPEQPLGSFSASTAGMTGSTFRTGYLMSENRFIRIGEPAQVTFDGGKFTITTAGNKVAAQKGGRTLRQTYLVMHHTNFVSTEKFPPPELFSNIVYETQSDFGFLQTADDILAYARRLLDEGYPAGIMVLADGWRDPSQSDFDKNRYPDPKAFIDGMHRLGFKVMLTVRPYIAPWGAEYARFGKYGLLVGGDKPWIMNIADGACAVVDMANPRTAEAVRSGLQDVAKKYNVDGFRMDCLDFIERYEGSAVDRETFLKAWHETGAEFALCEFMPGFPEWQADYVSYIRTPYPEQGGYTRDMILAGLAAGPFTFVEPALWREGVAENPAVSGIMQVRYALTQIMMPVARVPFAPWKYGFAAGEMKRTLAFRASLSKYMDEAFAEACKTVEPIVRPMEYSFAGSGFADCDDQYMLGDKYLIAPAVGDNAKRLVRLPKGTWRDMNGKKHKGPLVIEAETDGYRMIWFELQ